MFPMGMSNRFPSADSPRVSFLFSFFSFCPPLSQVGRAKERETVCLRETVVLHSGKHSNRWNGVSVQPRSNLFQGKPLALILVRGTGLQPRSEKTRSFILLEATGVEPILNVPSLGLEPVSFTLAGYPHTCPHSGDTLQCETVPCSPCFRRCLAASGHPRLHTVLCSRTLGLRAGSRPCSPSTLSRKRVHRRTG